MLKNVGNWVLTLNGPIHQFRVFFFFVTCGNDDDDADYADDDNDDDDDNADDNACIGEVVTGKSAEDASSVWY